MKTILTFIMLLLLTSNLFAKDINYNLTAIAKVDKKTKIVKTFKSKLIKFSASDSLNSNGNNRNLKYQWIGKNSIILSKKKTFVHKFDRQGIYTIILKVTDTHNKTASDKISIFVDMDKYQIANFQREQKLFL